MKVWKIKGLRACSCQLSPRCGGTASQGDHDLLMLGGDGGDVCRCTTTGSGFTTAYVSLFLYFFVGDKQTLSWGFF